MGVILTQPREPGTRATSANYKRDSTSFWYQILTEDPRIEISRTRCSRWHDGCYLSRQRRSTWRPFSSEKKTTTFQCNGSAVSKLIWLKLDLNLSNVYVEKRSPDGQCSIGVGPNVPVVWNQSVTGNENTVK
jgi:hypothetical protein